MAFQRRQIGPEESYHGRKLSARFVGPDLTAHVDDIELAGFYTDAEAARAAGRRYVDQEIEAEKKRGRSGS